MKMIALPKKRQERRRRLSSEGQCISQGCFKVNFKQKNVIFVIYIFLLFFQCNFLRTYFFLFFYKKKLIN